MTAVESVRNDIAGPAPAGGWLPTLSALRFVSVLAVFGFHVHVADVFSEGAVHTAMGWIFGPGAGGVSFFFVLSGFVLTWSARPGGSAARFWRRRFARIYPTYLVTLLAVIAAALVAGRGIDAGVAVPHLLLVQVWVPDPRTFYGLNAVSWFVACEAFFYLAFPLLHRLVLRLPGERLWAGAGVVLATVWTIPLLALLLPEAVRYWAIWILPPARLPEFVAGMLLARIVRERRWPPVTIWQVTLLVAVGYFASPLLPANFRLVAVTAAPFALLVAAVGAADAAGRSTGWRAPWMLWLGELSFAFYLVHQLALRLVLKVAGAPQTVWGSVTLVLTALAVALLSSWVLHRYVERPGARLFGGRRGGTAPRAAPL